MVRIFTAFAAAVAASVLALGGAAPAQAKTSGMAADFPVGTCIDYQNNHLGFNADDLVYANIVSCTDPARDYRVATRVDNPTQCGPDTAWAYTTRDVVVLCVVKDAPPVGAAAPAYGPSVPVYRG
ncbi:MULTISPECIES: hypothetical protein [unclassified Mycobacterium]|uniref:LppU/SCO3897 family protein n=1 Tax=unclassified Mycobacterium TaxID=2642494 RepID=UPI0029C6B5B3|nr:MULTISPECIES: hypothetical protein [unclassified Mycobacterium]